MRLLALSIVTALVSPVAHAASFSVDRLDDAVDLSPGDGVCLAEGGGCTLRAALQESNALAGADQIVLGSGVHLLSIAGTDEDLGASGDLDVSDALELMGEGPEATVIDASALDRVLDLRDTQVTRAISLRGLTLRNGLLTSFDADRRGGAGMRVGVRVQLDLLDVDIRDNVSPTFVDAVGISNRGCINGQRVRLLDNRDPQPIGSKHALAGAIFSAGSDSCLSLSDSQISRNQGANAGAIYADQSAPFTLRRTLVSDNLARSDGAFLLNQLNVVLLENVTITGNRGSGAVLVDGGATLTLRNCTVTANTGATGTPIVGGIHDVHGGFGRTFISNTILSGNGPGHLADDCVSVRSLDGGNILGDSARCQHQMLPSDQLDVDPGLGPLTDNGGTTLTHLPGPNAIDQGVNDACLAFDQRGLPRPADGDGDGQARCDVGAVEVRAIDEIFANGFEGAVRSTGLR